MIEPSASAMAISPEELLMEEVSALDTAGAANGAGTVSNDNMHGCDSEVNLILFPPMIAGMIFPLATLAKLDAR
jgi:hypothetical protein